MVPTKSRSSTRLSRSDWIAAARTMGVDSGFENLAVEPLAAKLGATKGSFYWHFRDRAELLSAVVEEWATTGTDEIIELVERGPAEDALQRLIGLVLGHSESDRTEWRLLSAVDHPLIGPVVARVHTARIDYMQSLFVGRGLTPSKAAARARVLYAAYLGNLALIHSPGLAMPKSARALRNEFLAIIDAPADHLGDG